MRFLKLLFFVVVFLSSSFSFGYFTKEQFDAGRTEKYGYSFYNGDPVYFVTLEQSQGPTSSYFFDCERLRTGVNPDDYGFQQQERGYRAYYSNVDGVYYVLLATPSDTSSDYPYLSKVALQGLRSKLLLSADNFFDLFDFFSDNIIIWVIAGTGLAVFLYTFRLCFYGFGKTVNSVSSNKDFKVSGGSSSVSVDKGFSRLAKSYWKSFADYRYRADFRRIYKFAADMPADVERSSLSLYNDYISLKDSDRDSLNSALVDYRKSHNYVGSNEYFLSVVESELFDEDEGIDYE